jgi:hypothetical protein
LALKNHNFIHFHDVLSPTGRFPVFHGGRWPHQTAVIQEVDTKNSYAVDSWFHDNGHPPEIVPLKQWKKGWKPVLQTDENTPE